MTYRDFDAEREQRWREEGLTSFKLGGETFTMRPVIDPLALAKYSGIQVTTDDLSALRVLDEVMLALILPAQGETYMAARERSDLRDAPAGATDEQVIDTAGHAIDLMALNEVLPWLVEQAVGRPTSRPSDSVGGPNGTGTSSTVTPDSAASTPDSLMPEATST